jgi:iron complex transport system substrate-binding protein
MGPFARLPVLVTLPLLAAALLAGCSTDIGGGRGAAGQGDEQADAGEEGDGTDVAGEDGGDAVTVSHALGTTEVPCTPERVVTLGQGQTDTALALGVAPVGVVEPWTDDWYPYLPDEIEQAETVGTELEPDLEQIAALDPDVILGSKLRHEEISEELAAIAPTVFAQTIGYPFLDNVSLWAEALCRPERGDEVLAEFDARTDELAEALGDELDTEVSMIRFMPDQARIYLTGFPGRVLEEVGLARPEAQQVDDPAEADQLIEISSERIPEMDGDVIFVMVSTVGEGGRTSEETETYDTFTASPLWDELDAVQAGRVHEVDEAHWNLGGGILAATAMVDDLERFLLDETSKTGEPATKPGSAVSPRGG